MNRLGRFADYLPIVAVVLGIVMILAAWSGAAGLDYSQGQIPYLISGGVGGLAFVLFGVAGLIVQTFKKASARQSILLEDISQTMQRVASALSVSGNGNVADGALVIAGSSSFHKPECKMVGEREGSVRVSREDALAQGLEACRICNP